MKKYIKYFAVAAASVLALASCNQEQLNQESVIKDSRAEQTEFDKWLANNLLNPYNIQIKYRYELMETNFSYWTTPADYEQSIIYAHLVKYLCVDTYDEVAGTTFTCKYFPKLFFLEGTFHYDNNGQMILGTAEGGRKIFLGGVNHLRGVLEEAQEAQDAGTLNEFYFKTIHHEFTHILNQTKDFTPDYKMISGTDYVLNAWDETNRTTYLKFGFISQYSQHSDREDFAEMLSTYVINTPQQWNAWMSQAGTEGAKKIEQKLEIVRSYMLEAWDIDLDELRDIVLRRTDDVLAGRVNLTDLTF
ncbi:MAG: putative zinc-binding metallopeptidase [Bacteroidales bacterium]|nr:putative zinc-binding metallopeptidase [Bacteroidales bacterium]